MSTESPIQPCPPGRDRSLTATLADEDTMEERAELSPHERLTCRLHRRWAYQCIASPVHVIPVTGHRWCRTCETSMCVEVDELRGTVALTCPRCGNAPATRATRQIIRTCQASIAAASSEAVLMVASIPAATQSPDRGGPAEVLVGIGCGGVCGWSQSCRNRPLSCRRG